MGLVGFAVALLAAQPAVAQQIERITVQPSTVEIGIGEVVLLTAIATFSDGSTANISELVEWTSSGPGVARVSNRRGSKGRVTARATGQASISVRDTVSGVSSGQSGGNAIVAVLGRLTALQIEPVDRRIEVGDSRNFRAIGTFSSGATRDVTPFVAWTSDNPNIARVSDDPSTRGRVTAVSPGVAIISVRSATGVDSTDSNGDARIRVPAELVSLRVLPATNDVPVGIRLSLDAEGTFNDATLDDVTNDVVWTSSNPAVAVVSNIEGSFGEVTALADGVTVISVVDQVTGVSSTASGGDAIVTVAGALVSIRLDPLEDSLPTGLTRTFSAQGVLDNGMTFNLSRRDVQWLAANPAVASISNDPATAGTLTAVAKGVTTVSAVHLPTGVRAEQDATITVLGRMIGLAVRPRLRELFSGQQDRFNAFALLDDGAEFRLSRDLQWVSSNDAVASISNVGGQRGQVTGNTKGECTVSVTHMPTGFSSTTSSSDGRVLVRGRVETVRIDPPRAFYVLGTEPRIRARAGFDDGSTENIRSDVLWSTSDATVAIVGNEAPKKGILQSFKVGQVTISAIEPVSGVSTTATGGDGVAIIVDGLQRLRVPAPEGADQMRTGDFFRLRALGTFPNPVPASGEGDTVDVDISEFVEFTSSDPNVIRVDAGRALAVGLGSAKVTARDLRTGMLSSQTPEGDATFTVVAALQRVKVKPGLVRTRVGSRKRIGFTAIGYYSDRAKIEITDKVTFGTADAGIATISNENTRHGLVIPVGPGNTSAFATEPITGIVAPSRRIVVKGGGKGRAR